jgi:hypothetical protein
MRRLAASIALGLLVQAAVCAGALSADRRAPQVTYFNFVAAFNRLTDAGFAVSVPYFPPFSPREPAEQGRGRLSNYIVVGERRAGDTVFLALTLPHRFGPLGSLFGADTRWPATRPAPNLIGLRYETAQARADDRENGYWIRVRSVAPLVRGKTLDVFHIASQTPPAGTRILYGGVLPNHHGVRPASCTITISLVTGGKTTAAGAVRRANAALAIAATVGRKLGPFARTATGDYCRIPMGGFRRRFVYGKCFTGVDLSGPNPVVIYRQLWDGRDFRAGGAPARPDLEHVWAVTVALAGRVLSVRSSGAFPPQLVR